jgi:ubiquinol-cytochrome c reductase iron-sulfur subunit
MLSAVYYAAIANLARLLAVGIIGRLNGWTRYDRNTYL